MLARVLRSIPLAVAPCVMATSRLAAQSASIAPVPSWLEGTAGSELEGYLRTLQLDSALARSYPQTIRGFAPSELARMQRPDGGGPWRDRFGRDSLRGRIVARVLRPSATLIANSGFPFGINDGPIWAGRGLTSVVSGGAIVIAGPVTLRVEPVAFRAENNAFPLFDNGLRGNAADRDPIEPDAIDLPQRFGSRPYQRIDLGQSELRIDLPGVAAGISNAVESWGPGVTHPLILGTNAPGFAHVFVATAYPLPIFIGRVHARAIAGRLEQSAYSPAADSLAVRQAVGLVATFMPRGLGGLEIGGTRFFHGRWQGWQHAARSITMPLDGLVFKANNLNIDDPTSPDFVADNQLASVFFRWPFAATGIEFYGEFARNDAALDLREVLTEPDHDSAYLLGFRRLVHRKDGGLLLIRGEWINSRITQLDRARPQARFYEHNQFVQGHTNRGQVLGSVAMLGGGGMNLGADLYDARGHTSIDLHRILRLTPLGEGAQTSKDIDAQHVIAVQRTAFVRGIDVVGGLTTVWELNRDFQRDAFNLGATLGVRFGVSSRHAAPSAR